MPTKGRRAFIPRAIAMFQAQDWPNKQLIIVADGEDIEDLLPLGHGHKANHFYDSQILDNGSILHHRFEGTLGAKLNRAALLAEGKYCINWDDDDWQAPNRISTQVAHLRLSGKPVVGFSSYIFYAEGEPHGWEYTGDAWYTSGGCHAYRREYLLAHPRPDKTVGEDNEWIAGVHARDDLSTISGTRCMVACDHLNNCSARGFGTIDLEFIRDTSDNFRRIPLSGFAATIGPYGSH